MKRYMVAFDSREQGGGHVLAAGKQFRLNEEALCLGLQRNLSPRVRDLVRVGMAVYVADRLSRRNRRSRSVGPTRDIDLTVEVAEPGFWRSQALEPLRRACELLSDDRWDITFVPRARETLPRQRFLSFSVPDTPSVCLYSGGLDSAAGLARQLRDRAARTLTVTAEHQVGQESMVRRQLKLLGARYGRILQPLVVRTSLIGAPRLAKQEKTQRCRSLLFAALGGAAACAVGASEVEVYENGVGALNLPLMAGMQVGGRSSRSSHPRFLRYMGQLVSLVAGRDISFALPFSGWTKAESVRALAEDGFRALACDTVSCVHYPLHEPGKGKQCGVCAACIGRRQALLLAGIDEPADRYRYDLFGNTGALDAVPASKLNFLKATIWQLNLLGELRPGEPLPDLLRLQLYGTRILEMGASAQEWVDVLVRYREEWLDLIAAARARGLSWGNWLSKHDSAA